MEVVIIVALVAAIAALYAARVGLPGRPRRIDVGGRQRAFLEEFLPVTEAEARRRGMSDEEIAAGEVQLREQLPLAPEGQKLEPDGTMIDRRKHTL